MQITARGYGTASVAITSLTLVSPTALQGQSTVATTATSSGDVMTMDLGTLTNVGDNQVLSILLTVVE